MPTRRRLIRDTLLCAALLPLPALARTPPTTAPATWRSRARIPWVVQEVYGAEHRGRAIIAGGMRVVDGRAVAIDDVGAYDPVADDWQVLPSLPAPRHHPVLASVGPRVLAIGGATHGGGRGHWRQRTDVFAWDGDVWSRLRPLPVAQSEGVAFVRDGRVHLVGGRTAASADASRWDEQRDVATHQVYDVAEDRWRSAAPLPAQRNSAAGAAIDGLFYIAGGRTMAGGNIARLDRYDPARDRWEAMAPMPHAAGGLGAAAIGGLLYACGGERLGEEGAGGVVADTVRYDPTRDAWQPLPPMPTPRHGFAAVAVGGALLAIGGGAHTATGLTTDRVEALLPAA